VRVVPEQKNFLERLMQSASGDEESPAYIKLGGSTSLVDLAKPHLAGLDPQRVRSVIQALEKLQLLEQDNVLCVMPNVPVQN
jgi:hypothetical protein